jgi:mono/diheme cytochrome c family protein
MKYKVAGLISLLAVLISVASCESEADLDFKRYYSAGAEIYQTHCQNCHGAKGDGLSALVPPLTDSLYLKNNKAGLACYLRSGLTGNITIHGKTFDDKMPASDLAPMEMAQVLTYVTNSFGNKLGVIAIDQVNADLKNCK